MIRNSLLAITSLLLTMSLSTAETYSLADAKNLSLMSSGWKSTQSGKSVAGRPLTLGGKVFKEGLGTHAPGSGLILLDGKAENFTATVGLDSSANGMVEFIVKADKKVVWKSGLLKRDDAAKEINIPLTGVKELQLLVTNGGNGNGGDHANWCNPEINYNGQKPVLSAVGSWTHIHAPSELAKARASLIPYPVKAQWGEKDFTLNAIELSTIGDKSKADSATKALTGLAVRWNTKLTSNGKNSNLTLVQEKLSESSNKEAYKLEVTEKGVKITANTSAGLFYGVQTLRQLATAKDGLVTIPHCSIFDEPAFEVRGFMHDVGRNFISINELKKQAETLAAYKLNIFHFHLTDTPAFRLESKKYPQLNLAKNQSRWAGKNYSIEEMKDFVKFCSDRHITIIPELDMPGHSAYFNKALGFGMQSDQGVKVLKELVDEWVEIFPGKWFHLGTDEVQLTRKGFVEEMTYYVRSKGKTTLSWHHGLHPVDGKTIHQCWNDSNTKNPMIDSLGYINTDDPVMIPRSYFFRQYCHVAKGSKNHLGGILCYWPDEPVVNQDVEMQIAPVYPALVAFAERIWQGNPNSWPVHKSELSFEGTPMTDGPRHLAFAEFENRLAAHRDKFFTDFRPEFFQFVKNADIHWKTLGPIAIEGDPTKILAPEKGLKDSYTINGTVYKWENSWGGTVSFKENYGLGGKKWEAKHTAYAVTQIHSDSAQEIDVWINFSRKFLAWPQGKNPAQGNWAGAGSTIWVNGEVIAPPVWKKPNRYRAPITEESYVYRAPSKVKLKKGINTIIMKSTDEFYPWTITFVPLSKKGEAFREAPGVRFIKDIKFK